MNKLPAIVSTIALAASAVLITWSIVYWTYRPIEAALLCVIIGKQWWDDWDDI